MNEIFEFSPSKKILAKNTDRVRLRQIYNLVFAECRKPLDEQLAGLKSFLTKVGGQRRAFYERDPVLVDTILSYDVDSEYKEIQRKRPFLGSLYCQNLFKQILRNWACAHLRPLLHLVDRKILAREGHYTKRLKLSVRIGA